MLTGLRGGASVRVPMSFEEFRALGELQHAEYYDGMCVVNPLSRRHVLAAKRLSRLLDSVCPAGFTTYPEWGWLVGRRLYEPDLMVAPVEAPEDELVDPPLLIVEVLSPSTRDVDLGSKREIYAAAGAQWYWTLAGPEDRVGPSLTVWRNEDGVFVEVQRLDAGHPQPTAGPVSVLVDPVALFA